MNRLTPSPIEARPTRDLVHLDAAAARMALEAIRVVAASSPTGMSPAMAAAAQHIAAQLEVLPVLTSPGETPTTP